MKRLFAKNTIGSQLRYFFLEKEFSAPSFGFLFLLSIPLVAYPLVLSDYENTATVISSSDQFENVTTNNSSSVQVTPNAELVVVKQVVNDDGGTLSLADFNITSSAGALAFDAGTNSGAITTYTSAKIYVPPGTYTLSELDVAGYSEGLWSCTEGVLSRNAYDLGEITLDMGQSTVCTIINDDTAPQLTLTKSVINDNGGALAVTDFDLLVDGAIVASGVASNVVANTNITISEAAVGGYTQGTWSCVDAASLSSGLPTAGAASGETLTLPVGADVTCEISNDDIVPQLTLVKNLTNDNGGNLTVADFDLSIDGVVVPNSTAQSVVANTALTISELVMPGYTAGTWACVDSTGLTTGLPTAGVATGESVTLAVGADVTCEINNDDIAPTLTLAKTVTNDNGGSLAVADFDISIDGAVVANNSAVTVSANTAINISELAHSGYTQGKWECVDANNLTTVLPSAGVATGTSLTLASGSDVTCSITNDDIAPTLTLIKNVVNDNGGELNVVDFDLSIDNTVVPSGTPNSLFAGISYTISEVVDAGYTPGTWSCVDANNVTTGLPTVGDASNTVVTLAEGAEVSCKITNDDIAPTLTLAKTVVNDDGGTLTAADFDISVDGTVVSSGVSQVVAANTDISISELDLPGYAEGSWSCVDANDQTSGLPSAGLATGTNIKLAPGADVLCEITNDDLTTSLKLVKNLVNDNGGDLTIADFEVSVDGAPVAVGTPLTVTPNTPIVISELDLAGYTTGTWSCTDAAGLATGLPTAGAATGETITLTTGSEVTCEITNDDIAPTLSLVKSVVNNHGGTLAVTDFDISIDGTEVVSGQAMPVMANTAIMISELDLGGYTEGSWSCVDSNDLTAGLPTAGAATNTAVTLEPGSVVECSITNEDIQPTLTLVKTLNNNNGGASTIADFDIAIDGVEVTSGSPVSVLANTQLTISELDLAGYTEGAWSCVDANSLSSGLPAAGTATGVSFMLAPGADVTCSITNHDVAPTLTLSKTLVNDNGGNLTIADFDIAIDGTEVTNGVANPVAANTNIVISELDLPGYKTGVWSCVDNNNLTTALPTAGDAIGTTLNLLEGSDVVCEITNNDIAPTLTLAKTVTNNDGGSLTVEDFDIAIDGVEVPSGVAQTVLANTAIDISEIDVAGYNEGVWSCKDANGLTSTLPTAGVATGETLTLALGSDVTCSIENDDIAPQLTLITNVINDDGGVMTVADYLLSIAGASIANATAQSVQANVAISIAENDLPGYTEGVWSCTDANNQSTGLLTAGIATGDSVTLAPGSDVTCVITNNDIPPTLTLVKNLINDNGGSLTVADFDIAIDGVEVTSGAAQTMQANTAITISELVSGGYQTSGWECIDANDLTNGLPTAGAAAGETITLASGADVSCEISNNDIPPTLTLVKTVVNDNGGDGIVDDFDIAIDGTEVVSGALTSVTANAAITISELDLPQYAEGVWSCTDANDQTASLPTAGDATGTTIALAPGSDVTCEITNNDLGIDLTIAKVVSDSTPNIGDTVTFTLTVNNSGPDIATNATVNDVVLAGFTYVPGSITGGTTSDDTDPSVAGLSWTLATVPVNSPITLTFDVIVNAP